MRSVVKEGYLQAVTTPEPADAFLIAVPTPFKSNGLEIPEPDLGYIERASKAIAQVFEKGRLGDWLLSLPHQLERRSRWQSGWQVPVPSSVLRFLTGW